MGVAASRDRPRHRDGEEAAKRAVAHREGMAVVGRRARGVRFEHVRGCRERGTPVGVEAQEPAVGRGRTPRCGHSRRARTSPARPRKAVNAAPTRASMAFPPSCHEGVPRALGHRRMPAGAYAPAPLQPACACRQVRHVSTSSGTPAHAVSGIESRSPGPRQRRATPRGSDSRRRRGSAPPRKSTMQRPAPARPHETTCPLLGE